MLISPFNTFFEFKFSSGLFKRWFWFFLYVNRVVCFGQIPPFQVPTVPSTFGVNGCLLAVIAEAEGGNST